MIGGFFHTLQGTLIPPYDINKKSIFFVRKSLCISKKIITFAPRNKEDNIATLLSLVINTKLQR